MTLKELLESGLIRDEEIICIHRPLYGSAMEIRQGHWYQDNILNIMDATVDTMKYCCGSWDIDLQFEEEDF